MRNINLEGFKGRSVVVETGDYKISGVLKDYEKSNHGGFGNLMLLQSDGTRILIRGSMVTTIKVLKQ